jgi:hypothetical protein
MARHSPLEADELPASWPLSQPTSKLFPSLSKNPLVLSKDFQRMSWWFCEISKACNSSKSKSRFQAFCPPNCVSKRSTPCPNELDGDPPYFHPSTNRAFQKEEIDILPMAEWSELAATTSGVQFTPAA